ncbi:MAG: putative zinc-binding protein [Ancalomicrobiaceae bacterium]|nr:putative zinc-binding protein [Ancalomicrobiaceae bacterium]
MSGVNCCAGPGANTLIFSCSGAADVGEIADRTARKLTRDRAGKMFCLAGVGGRVASILKITGSADRLLAIDGCTQNCASSCLQEAGFEGFASLRLAELGLEKGLSPATDETVARAAEAAVGILAA